MSVGLRLAAELKAFAAKTPVSFEDTGVTWVEARDLMLEAADELERNEEWQKMAYDNGYALGFKDGQFEANRWAGR